MSKAHTTFISKPHLDISGPAPPVDPPLILAHVSYFAGMVVDWWRDILTTSLRRPHWTPTALYYIQDKNFAKFVAVIDFFELLE